MNNETKTEISKEALNNLHHKLRAADNSWATVLAARAAQTVKADPTLKKFAGINRKKVYNVFNFAIKDRSWRLFIYAEGTKYLSDLEAMAKSALAQTP